MRAWLGILFGLGVSCVIIAYFLSSSKEIQEAPSKPPFYGRLLKFLEPRVVQHQFPDSLTVGEQTYQIQYTFEEALQEKMGKLIRSYRPDYAAFVAMDANTGRIMTAISYSPYPLPRSLLVQSSFPAASIFKIVTSALAIEDKQFKADSEFPFTGSMHTLYKRNVTALAYGKRAPKKTLRDAFANSINSIFGRIGFYFLDFNSLHNFSKRFLFDVEPNFEIPFEKPGFSYDGKQLWELAELSSGFNRKITLNPVQGAMIAASIAAEGLMPSPYWIDKIDLNDSPIYQATPHIYSRAIDARTAAELRKLMTATVETGTSRKSFSKLRRQRVYRELEVGGKTGSITGTQPEGKYDWFVGYAKGKNRNLALCALTINRNFWKVKSAYLASQYIEWFYKE